MSIEIEYLNPTRFPLTTQKGLDFSDQMLLDAFHMNELEQEIDFGHQLNETQTKALKELREKAALLIPQTECVIPPADANG